jgi:hypothetical protein
MRKLLWALLLPLLGVNGAHATAPSGPPDLGAIARAHRQFAVDLYKQVSSDDGNQFLSPTSIARAPPSTR